MQHPPKKRPSYHSQLTELIDRQLQLRHFQTVASLTFKRKHQRRRLSSKAESAQSSYAMIENAHLLGRSPFQREFSDAPALSDADVFKLAVAASEQISDDQGVSPREVAPGKIFLTENQASQLGFYEQ